MPFPPEAEPPLAPIFFDTCTLTTDVIDLNFLFSYPGTILVDTFNLSETAQKKTPKDEAIVAELQQICSHIDTQQLFDDIEKVKFDVSGNVTFFMIIGFLLSQVYRSKVNKSSMVEVKQVKATSLL